jgi:Dolichyl-phosphate-mannose-protein mannosyltransferase
MTPASSSPRGAGHSALRRCFEGLAIFAAAFACYLANGRGTASGDAMPNRYLPVAILRDRSFALDGFPFLYSGGLPYWLEHVHGHYVSFYPVSGAVLAVPFYLPAVLGGETRDSPRWEHLAKRSAAAIVALSVALLYTALRRLTSPGMALCASAAYALGSSSWSVSSMGLWQHGPTQLGLAAALYCLVRGHEEDRWLGAAGLPLAFAAISRPTGVLLALALSGYVVWRRGPAQTARLAVAALPVAAFQAWYNLHYHGDLLWTQFPPFKGWYWQGRPIESLSGMLLSPGRGLFVYSPVFVFSVVALACAWRRGGDPLLRAIGVGTLLVLAFYGKWKPWWGGATFGPRLLADLTPLLAFALHPWRAPLASSRVLRGLFAAVLLWSVAAHAVGAFWEDRSWNAGPIFVDRAPQRLWSWSDNQLVNPVVAHATVAFDRAFGIPIPVKPLVEERLRMQIERIPWSDRAIEALRGLYHDARRDEDVAALDRLKASRFSPRIRVDWRFGGGLRLVGYDFEALDPRHLEITYYWRAEKRLARRYFAFVHFEGPSFRFQDDYPLGVPGYGTDAWQPRETVKVVRRVAVPSAAPSGEYSLDLGVWSPDDRRILRLRRGWWGARKAGVLLGLIVSADRPLELAPRRDPP